MWTPGGASEPGRRVYLDSASGQPLHPAAREAFAAALNAAYADPRRLHHAGRAARLVLDNARAANAAATRIGEAAAAFAGEVRARGFPTSEQTYRPKPG